MEGPGWEISDDFPKFPRDGSGDLVALFRTTAGARNFWQLDKAGHEAGGHEGHENPCPGVGADRE